MKEDTSRTIELAWPNDAGFTSDPAHVANIFADQYRELGRDTPPDGHTFDMDAWRCQDIRVAELLKLPLHRGPIGHDVTVAELFRAIGKMQYGKASGGDLISTDLLKMLAKEFGEDDSNPVFDSLVLLFKQCLSQGKVLSDWSTAIVKVLFKQGDRTDWANYRLMSLLSVVGKLFESVLVARLGVYLDKRLLSPFQCGFRKERRCQHHSFVLAEAVKSNARKGKRTYAAFLDVRKAYPTMRRSAMLGRLYENMGDGGIWNGSCGRQIGWVRISRKPRRRTPRRNTSTRQNAQR